MRIVLGLINPEKVPDEPQFGWRAHNRRDAFFKHLGSRLGYTFGTAGLVTGLPAAYLGTKLYKSAKNAKSKGGKIAKKLGGAALGLAGGAAAGYGAGMVGFGAKEHYNEHKLNKAYDQYADKFNLENTRRW